MAIFAMPIVLMIEADSVEEAQKSIDDWAEDIDHDYLPAGLDDLDHSPQCDHNDEGQRLLYLATHDAADEELSSDDDEDDDFNDAEIDF
jgi:hypothetical protein